MQLALGAPDTLGYALATAIVALLALLPGLPLAFGLGRRSGWDLPGVLAASFALQVGVVGPAALGARMLGLSLAAVAATALVTLAGGGAAALAWRPLSGAGTDPRGRVERGTGGLAVAAACLLLGVAERTWFSHMADAFYHLAAVRSLLATGRPLVTDPLFGTAQRSLDATAGAWHTLLAVWSRLTGLDVAAWLWPGAAGVGAALVVLALWSLARHLSRSPLAATIAAAAWLFAGMSADVRWSAYPNRISLALALVTLAALVRLAESPSVPDGLVAAVAGFATIATHLAAGGVVAAAGVVLLALAGAAALLARARGAPAWARPAALLGVGAAAAALAGPLVLPKAGVVRTSWLVGFHEQRLAEGVLRLPGGLLADAPGHLMKVPWPVFAFGTVVAIAAGVRAFRSRDPRALAVAALAGTPALLLLDPPVTTLLLRQSYYLTQRVAILLPFTAFVALAWLAGASLEAGSDRRAVLVGALALVVLAAAAAAGPATSSWASEHSVFATRGSDVRAAWGRDTCAKLAAALGRGYPRVASDPETSYYLAGLAPVSVCAVTSQHTPFAFEAADGQARRDDMRALMSPHTAEADRRGILARRGADFVLVPKYRGGYHGALSAMRDEPELLRPVFETDTLALFAVVRGR